MKISQTFDFYIRTTHLSLTRIYNILLKQFGITQTEALVLINVKKDGTPITKLAQYLNMQDASLNRQLKRMQKAGFILRKKDQFDKRITRIFLTQKGVELRKKVKQLAVELNNQFLSLLSNDEQQIFFSLFDKIRQQITAIEAKIIKNQKL